MQLPWFWTVGWNQLTCTQPQEEHAGTPHRVLDSGTVRLLLLFQCCYLQVHIMSSVPHLCVEETEDVGSGYDSLLPEQVLFIFTGIMLQFQCNSNFSYRYSQVRYHGALHRPHDSFHITNVVLFATKPH